MKEHTLLLAHNFYYEIRDKLKPEERATFKWILNSLTWTKFDRDFGEGFHGIYSITLVDGTTFDSQFRYDGGKFYTSEKNKSPTSIY
jgi:hypothetical protein